jgi:uncharacterized protein (TIGR00725 family)
MKIKVGVLGSADDTLPGGVDARLRERAESLGRAIAARDLLLLTGATTGLTYITARSARAEGAFHVGISPASNEREHVERYELPLDSCDCVIYTGFGLKGRNVVLVRSCDIAVFIGGSMGSLNEFTIAYDEGRVMGCLTGTGGVADDGARLIETFAKQTAARVLYDSDPLKLITACLEVFGQARQTGKGKN